MRDRVAQEVIRRLIEPQFEPHFSNQSYGFRPHRNCHDAIRALLKFWKSGFRIVLDADIQGFFDNISHSLIMKMVAFAEGFDFLGFHFSKKGATIRMKSTEKFKEKIRTLTIRSNNFSDEVVNKINRVTRGFANYYAADFSTVKGQFFKLDQFIRRRLRCMKKKRISCSDNYRIPNRYFERKELVSLYSLAKTVKEHLEISPIAGQC